MIAFSFVFPFLPLYVRELGVTEIGAAARWAGGIGAASAITMTFAQPLWGRLADRYGRRLMVLRSLAAASVTLTLMGLVQAPWQLLILRLLQGALTGTLAASNALVAASVPRARLGASLGFMQVALFIGTSAGPLLGGGIAERLGFRAACFAAGGLMLVALGLVSLFVHESFTPPTPETPRHGPIAEARALLAMPGLLLVLGVGFAIHCGSSALSPILSLFVHELSAGINAAGVAGIIMAGTGVTSALAAVIVGRLGDRWGYRRLLPLALLGAAIVSLPQAFVRDPEQLFGLRLLLGLFLGGLLPTTNALLAGLVPDARRGAAFGLSGSAASLANAIGPLGGALLASAVDMRTVFVATATLYAVGFGLVLAQGRRLPRGAAEPPVTLVPPAAVE